MDMQSNVSAAEKLRRWRLVLGPAAENAMNEASGEGAEKGEGQSTGDGDGEGDEDGQGDGNGKAKGKGTKGGKGGQGGSEPGESQGGTGAGLNDEDAAMDNALSALYGDDAGIVGSPGSKAGLGSSAPTISRWLGDIRNYFPSTVVQVMQKDAMERLNLKQMLLEPEFLSAVEPDVHLVSTLIGLNKVMPERTKESARVVIRAVVDELHKRLAEPLRKAVTGALNRATIKFRPRHNEIDWNRTIRANLRHYQPEYQSIIPERLIGFSRKNTSLLDLILLVDQSGSMMPSVVFASIFSAVMASIRSVKTSIVMFDTSVVDLSHLASDPVELLFGAKLGGGTNIDKGVAYCEGLVRKPKETIFVLISDLIDGGKTAVMLRRMAGLIASGVRVIILLALDDKGTPRYDKRNAAKLVKLGAVCFACTPDLFPDMMAAAIKRQDMEQWAASKGIVTVRASED